MAKKTKIPTLKEIEDNFHEWKSDPKLFEFVKARNDKLRKDIKEGKINMRVNSGDLHLLMNKAAEKGIGYQTLLSSLIHLYVNDQLVDITEVRKVMDLPKKLTRAAVAKKRT